MWWFLKVTKKLLAGLQLPDQGTTNDPNVIAYQTNLQQAFLQSAMAQNIRIQQQLLAQNQAFQQLLLQQHISVIISQIKRQQNKTLDKYTNDETLHFLRLATIGIEI